MKRWTWLAILGAVALIAVALFATTAFARGPRGWMAASQSAPTADAGDNGDWDCPMHDGSGAAGYGMMGGGSGMMGGGIGLGNQATVTRIAGVLGISADDLLAQLKDGVTVAQVAEAKKVSLDTLVDTILAPEAEILKVRVKYGYLTQEQADSILQTAAQRVEQMLTIVHPGLTGERPAAGQGYGRGHGGMMGGGSSGGMMGGGSSGGMMSGGSGSGMMGSGSSGGVMGW